MMRRPPIAGALTAVIITLATSAGAQSINPPLPAAGPSSSLPTTIYSPASALPDPRPDMASEDLSLPPNNNLNTNCAPPNIPPTGSAGVLPLASRPC